LWQENVNLSSREYLRCWGALESKSILVFLLNPRERGRHLIEDSVERKEDDCQSREILLKTTSPGG
jgi:hypothetical protein